MAGKGIGILALLGGKPKGKPPMGGGEGDDESAEPSDEDGMIDDFVSAVKDGDSEGARAAFKAAVRACSKSYGEESDEGEA